MGKRTGFTDGVFCWVDLATTDLGTAREFYRALFGWDYSEPNGPLDYRAALLGGDAVAGTYRLQPELEARGVPAHWFSYVAVDSADAVASRAVELGGSALDGPFDVPEGDPDVPGTKGRLAVLQDPTGAMLGAWGPRTRNGAERVNDPGCLTWNELSTDDPQRAEEFYAVLFGWQFQQVNGGGPQEYWAIGHPEAAAGRNGGMRWLAAEQQQAGVGPHWMPYFTVTDTRRTLEVAGRAGGEVLVGPLDLPTGRIAIVADPGGAVFGTFEGDVDD